jgi:hypothetical protein
MKTLILTSMLTAAALMAQTGSTAAPGSAPAAPQNSTTNPAPVKKHRKAKKPAKPATSTTNPAPKPEQPEASKAPVKK